MEGGEGGDRGSLKSRVIDNISRKTQPKRSSVAKISYTALGAIYEEIMYVSVLKMWLVGSIETCLHLTIQMIKML